MVLLPGVKTSTAPIKFGLDEEFDKKAYEALPEWLRNMIARSPEYQNYVAPEVTRASTADRLNERLAVADSWDPEPSAAKVKEPAAAKVEEPPAESKPKRTSVRPGAESTRPAPKKEDEEDLADDDIPF